jgi:hypothetical protein
MIASRASGLALCLAASLAAQHARADEIDQCIDAHSEAQRLRLDGKLTEARADLVTCSREKCPSVVRAACGKWLGEVDEQIPSVVISVRNASGGDVTDAHVSIDGAPTTLDGRPLNLDPGKHQLRAEVAGHAAIEQTVVMSAGEHAREVVLTIADPAKSEVPTTPPSTPTSSRPIPIIVYPLAAIGIVALGSFTVFGLSGRSDYFDYKQKCATSCTSSDGDSARTKLIVADVSLGVSVVAIGAATYFFLARPTVSTTPARVGFDFRATQKGAAASATWAF